MCLSTISSLDNFSYSKNVCNQRVSFKCKLINIYRIYSEFNRYTVRPGRVCHLKVPVKGEAKLRKTRDSEFTLI